MKTRIISAAIIIPFALAVLLLFPPIILTLVISVISAFAAYELFAAVNKTCKKTPSPRAAIYAIIAAVMVPFVVYIREVLSVFNQVTADFDTSFSVRYDGGLVDSIAVMGFLTIVFILMSLILVEYFLTLKSEKRLRLRQLLITPVAALIIPYMLSALIVLRVHETTAGKTFLEGGDLGRWLVMLPVIITILTDSGAYFTGVLFGKHKPLPNISPNKTAEGFVGGIVIGAASVLIYGLIAQAAAGLTVNMPLLLVYGIAGAVVTEAGDLVFSLIKRKCGIKDYGNLIPGHGGALDRFDSLIFTAPSISLLMIFIPALSY